VHLCDRYGRALPLVVLAFALSGCTSDQTVAPRLPARGPAHTLRVALAEVPWPLPERPHTRDETQLAETLRVFHVVRARPGEIVARHRDLQIVFRQLEPHRAAVLFRRSQLDEAPVPLGDIRAALADEVVESAVRVTRLTAVDSLLAPLLPASLRRVLSVTADRKDYALLVPENPHAAARPSSPRVFRKVRRAIPTYAGKQIRIAVEGDAALRYGATLLAASWRDLGLDVRLAQHDGNAFFVRHAASGGIAIAHAVDARFLSPRVQGWREDARGVVDYGHVTLRVGAPTRAG
jgi:hypothetical protein